MSSLLSNSIGTKLSKSQRNWLSNANRLMKSNQYTFCPKVEDLLVSYFEMLSETKTLVPLTTLRMQLDVLSAFKNPQDQVDVVSYTIYRGWKNLCYAIDRQTKLKTQASQATAKFKEV